MASVKAWISAFRLRTLPLSLSGIILGSFIAYSAGFWHGGIFAMALVTTLFFQILSNLANDLGDTLKGTDNADRVGPMRAVQSGEISVSAMKKGVAICSVLGLFSASFLIFLASERWTQSTVILYGILAVAATLAALGYTLGKKAYGYLGLGDIFVFLFFGLLSVLGVYGLYDSNFQILNILPACTIGFLSAAVLNLNNMRDRVNDAKSGKSTLVVKIGGDFAKMYHALLIIGAAVTFLIFLVKFNQEWSFISLLPFALLFLHLRKVMATKIPSEFDPELKKVALSTFLITVLFAVSVLISF